MVYMYVLFFLCDSNCIEFNCADFLIILQQNKTTHSLGHHLLHISFSSEIFPEVHAGGRTLPLFIHHTKKWLLDTVWTTGDAVTTGNAITYSTRDITSLYCQGSVAIICACVIMPIMAKMRPPKKHAGRGWETNMQQIVALYYAIFCYVLTNKQAHT